MEDCDKINVEKIIMINKINNSFLQVYSVNHDGGYIYVDRKTAHWLDSFNSDNQFQNSNLEKKIFSQITKSGFYENPKITPPEIYPKISVILVLYNSKFWVENLIKVFNNLSEWLHEIIVIDNGSNDDSLKLLQHGVAKLVSIQNLSPNSFASAINQGTRIATGEVFLIINPDVYIPKTSLWELIHSYQKNQNVAAISPKLLLMKTPGFINGIGNIVRPFWHGYDIGLGHLDVGQFDHVEELPSACFASIFIPRLSWELVGELDEEFPMYYEDSDWCYRAQKIGRKIFFESNSLVYHGFGNFSINKNKTNLEKIYNITYGRTLFVKKHIQNPFKVLYSITYFIYDLLFSIKHFFLFHKNLFPLLFKARRDCNKKQVNQNLLQDYGLKSKNHDLVLLKLSIFPRIKNGFPVLFWKDIQKYNKNF